MTVLTTKIAPRPRKTLLAHAEQRRAAVAETLEIERSVSQDGIARVFARRYADRLRYCHHTGSWYEWTGFRWARDETDLAFQFARELGREFSEAPNGSELREAKKVAFAAGVERFARGDRALAVTSSAWDADPLLLGTPGGTVDLRTGILRPSDPRDGITKLTAASPSDTADCPRWLTFLDEATGFDAELIRFLQLWAGYCLTGLTREHALVFVHGPGGNGKSVAINVLTGILHEYAATAAMETFTAAAADRHPTDLAMLRGARLVTASETEEGRAWAEARIKSLTGGDPVTARFMRQDFFTFLPTFKLTIIGNHQPVLRTVDEAARRRFNIVPFNYKPERPDQQLEVKLRQEWPEILRWMIEGALAWQVGGLTRPAIVEAATDGYFADQDALGQWLAEECEFEPHNLWKNETTSDLFASWSTFAIRAGDKPGSAKAFSSALQRRGLSPYRKSHSRGFTGVRLRRPMTDDAK